MSAPPEDPPDAPARELGRGPAIRDAISGAAVLAIGVVSGGSVFYGAAPDAIDVVFDVLGAALLLWGLGRLAWSFRTSR